MSAFSVENPHNGKTFENYSRFEWGVEVGVVTTFMLRLFVLHEFDMKRLVFDLFSCLEIYLHLHKLPLDITLSNCYGRCQTPYGDIQTIFRPQFHYCLSSVHYCEGRFHTYQFRHSSHI